MKLEYNILVLILIVAFALASSTALTEVFVASFDGYIFDAS